MKNSLPLYTFMSLPTISGIITMSLQCVFMSFLLSLRFCRNVLCCSGIPLFNDLLCLDGKSSMKSFWPIDCNSSSVFPLYVNSFLAILTPCLCYSWFVILWLFFYYFFIYSSFFIISCFFALP